MEREEVEIEVRIVHFKMVNSSIEQQIEEARAVVLKTASNFQYFAKWRSDLIRVDTPGMTQSNLRGFDWVKAPVPTHPLHAEAREGEWDADQGWLR